LKTIFFKSKAREFEQFKARYMADIDDAFWQEAAIADPGVAKYCLRNVKAGKPIRRPAKKRKAAARRGRSRSPSPAAVRRSRSSSQRRKAPKKRKLMIGNVFDSFDGNAPDDQSVFYVKDRVNPNLPAPLCRGIRRVCRDYGPDKRYRQFSKDGSENDEYVFDVDYD
jgi:hypothetical protein